MSDSRPVTHEDIQALLGAYALDAVAPDEAELVARHLEVCPRCRAEVQEHREVAGLLGYAGQEAPAGLWDRITASMQEAPPALRLQRVGDDAFPSAPGSEGAAAPGRAAGGVAARPQGAGAGGPRGGARYQTLRVRALAALAVAAAVAVAVLGVQVARLDHRTSTISHEVSLGTPSMSAVTQALSVPGARKVILRPVADGQTVNAVILPGGQGYLYDAKLSALPSSQTYQLWGVTESGTVSYGLLGSTPAQVVGFRAGAGISALAITAEVAGGVERSTHAPVAAGAVPAV
ncbi:anti-sigma factor [Acidiferrimicrobium sp. IK]|uniref:anti-sigma factor n=1 Tax=Acidiferrimicrobium sp. IK TaxID=2871700 RepID=UPI0021CB0AF8|nr:anti-sigma factor [Acidiferrimicrobium sp. IK]MCU4184157.1 anti-sigma factor [Acidiferrimicrobium sp. IK]